MFTSDRQALKYLYSLRRMNIKLGLENISALVDVLDNPHETFPAIHVAGTNGKGSTCAILESLYRAAGYKTGLYTSPHLVDVCERVRVNGKMIPFSFIRRMLGRLQPVIEGEGCSFFEVLTAIAFAYFRQRGVEMAIIEVGMGGRLDATNIIFPEAAVITEIDLDHTRQLGTKPKQIATEKAGIIKPSASVVTNISRRDVVRHVEKISTRRYARFTDARQDVEWQATDITPQGTFFDLKTPFNRWQRLQISLLGTHQLENAVAAVRTAEILTTMGFEFSPRAIRRGLRSIEWPGRLQIIRKNPTVIVDVAHNPHGIERTINEIAVIFPGRRIYCMLGVLAGKDYPAMIRSLNKHVYKYIAITPEDDRALPAAALAKAIRKTGKTATIAKAILPGLRRTIARVKRDDVICVLGSHFNLEKILKAYKKP